jgi:stage II sporulation protein GA (sporulation sigma-E factor processing peptidase)
MVQVVYIDVLFAVNLIINYFILRATSGILHRRDKRLRVFLGAALGAVYSIFIFSPELSFLYTAALKVVFSVTIVLVSFKFTTFKTLVKLVILFYIISFLFGGIIFALYLFVTPAGMVMRNGVVYFNISPVVLILSGAVCYIIITLVSRVLSHSRRIGTLYDIRIEADEKSVQLKAFMDTGNNLADALTGLPVVIADYEPMKQLVPRELWQTFQTGLITDPSIISNSKWVGRFHMIPYGSVGAAGGLLPAFKPDRLTVMNRSSATEVGGVLVAISGKRLNADGNYHALLGPLIFNSENPAPK